MKKPKVVEFMGLPRAGKTDNSEEATRKLRGIGHKVRCIQDQIKDAPFADELEKNRWSIRETGNLISEAKSQDWDVILVDRGGWAHYASLQAILDEKRLVETDEEIKEVRLIQSIARDVARDEDFFILIEVPVEVCLERDRQLGGTQVGKIINPSLLSKMEEAYQALKKRLPSRRLLLVDGQEDFLENQEKILKFLLEKDPQLENCLQCTLSERGGSLWKGRRLISQK